MKKTRTKRNLIILVAGLLVAYFAAAYVLEIYRDNADSICGMEADWVSGLPVEAYQTRYHPFPIAHYTCRFERSDGSADTHVLNWIRVVNKSL